MAETKINGLSTPALTEGQYFDALAESPGKASDRSTLDVVAEIEHKLKTLVEQLEKDDAELDSKLDALAGKLQKLREQL